MKLSPHWENRFLEWSNASMLAERYSKLPEGLRGPHHEGVLKAFQGDAERERQLLQDCEAIGRRIFRSAILAGDLKVRSVHPQDKYIPGTNGFYEIELSPPEDAEWVNSQAGAFVAVPDTRAPMAGPDGWAVTTYFSKDEFEAWLVEALKAPKPKSLRMTRKKRITRLVLEEYYGPDGNIGFDSPDLAAERIIAPLEVAGFPLPKGPRGKQLEAISKRVERDQKEMGFR